MTHLARAFIQSGEVAQRHSQVRPHRRWSSRLINTITFEPTDEPQIVWTSGDVRVSAIRATHMPGNMAYRVDTPAGAW